MKMAKPLKIGLNRKLVIAMNEIWRPYPKIDFIEGSNLGRVRTIDHYVTYKNGAKHFCEGHDLPQYHNRQGYVRVTVTTNRKTVGLSVHRIIASCFLPNPDNLPQVNHKNCIRDDNRVENLEWCDASYNNRYREKYGVSMTESQGHSLFAYNLKTGEKLRFRSQHEAGRKTDVPCQNINKVIGGKLQQAGGYYFTEDENEVTKEKLEAIKDNTHLFDGVIAIAMEKQEPLYFKSQSEAGRQLRVSQGDIGRVIRGQRNHAGGYWFTRVDSSMVANTRTKFGDSVAERVVKIMGAK